MLFLTNRLISFSAIVVTNVCICTHTFTQKHETYVMFSKYDLLDQ